MWWVSWALGEGNPAAAGGCSTDASGSLYRGCWNTLVSGRVPGPMARAVFDGVVTAERDDVRNVEGMTYFPVDSVDMDKLVESPRASRCFWKGKASYGHVQGRSDVVPNAAFAYEHPWPLARRLVEGRIAFWQGVRIVRD